MSDGVIYVISFIKGLATNFDLQGNIFPSSINFPIWFNMLRYIHRYCGHGNGESYLKGSDIQRLQCKAVTILMGCSSGKLQVSHIFACLMIQIKDQKS